MATFDETLFPCCPGAKTLARTDLSETPDLEGHIPHGMPDGGLTPPGPSSKTSSPVLYTPPPVLLDSNLTGQSPLDSQWSPSPSPIQVESTWTSLLNNSQVIILV